MHQHEKCSRKIVLQTALLHKIASEIEINALVIPWKRNKNLKIFVKHS